MSPKTLREWVYGLSKRDLMSELESRNLSISGIVPVLRERLCKFERNQLADSNDSGISTRSALYSIQEEESLDSINNVARGPENSANPPERHNLSIDSPNSIPYQNQAASGEPLLPFPSSSSASALPTTSAPLSSTTLASSLPIPSTSTAAMYTGTVRRATADDMLRIENFDNMDRELRNRNPRARGDTIERNRAVQRELIQRNETPLINENDRLSMGLDNVNRRLEPTFAESSPGRSRSRRSEYEENPPDLRQRRVNRDNASSRSTRRRDSREYSPDRIHAYENFEPLDDYQTREINRNRDYNRENFGSPFRQRNQSHNVRFQENSHQYSDDYRESHYHNRDSSRNYNSHHDSSRDRDSRFNRESPRHNNQRNRDFYRDSPHHRDSYRDSSREFSRDSSYDRAPLRDSYRNSNRDPLRTRDPSRDARCNRDSYRESRYSSNSFSDSRRDYNSYRDSPRNRSSSRDLTRDRDFNRNSLRYNRSPVSSDESPDRNRGSHYNSRPSRTNIASACENMRRWNLKFSAADGEDAESFVRQLLVGKGLFHVRDEDMFQILPVFLKDVALNWFNGVRFRWRSFEHFIEVFRTRFGDSDLQFEIKQEIKNRTQGENEKVSTYLVKMWTLLDRVDPPYSEAEEISCALRNMLPRLQTSIHRSEIHTREDLDDVAIAVEKRFRVAKHFRPPPTPERSLFPDLAYRESRTRAIPKKKENLHIVEEYSDEDSSDEEVHHLHLSVEKFNIRDKSSKPTDRNRDSKKNSTPNKNSRANPNSDKVTDSELSEKPKLKENNCWNCGIEGHRNFDCKEKRIIFCYGCGKKDFTRPKCPTCQGNQSGSR